jgi:hypothetical protein
MTTTLYLDPASWDLVLDAAGSIAVCANPYQLAQDAASAIRTFAGEVFYDTARGVPYFDDILGRAPSMPLLKARLVQAAKTVPGVESARVYLTANNDRTITGQVQVSDSSGKTAVASF